MRLKAEQGFILPLAVLLVIILTISGTAFMQHDYLERRMAMNNVDNHGGFYLANAGIERAHETFKLPPDNTWTLVLNGAYPDYPKDPSPVFCPLCLCGPNPSSGCVIPSFGALVNSGIPFDAAFNAGQYEVRAFNNEPSLTDTDQILIVRVLGTVRGEQKLLEATIRAIADVNLMNCGSGSTCPNSVSGNPGQDAADGRRPAVGPVPLLTHDPGYYPLTDSRNYYRFDLHPEHFSAPLVPNFLVPNAQGKIDLDVQNDSYYLITDPTAKVTVSSAGLRTRVVVYSLAQVTINGVDLDNSIIISSNAIDLKGNNTISAPLPYPAVVSGSDITGGDAHLVIHGTLYAAGTINVNPIDVYGAVIGNNVQIQGSSTYTDGHLVDPNYLKYYAIMPGFYYPPELLKTVTVPGGWRELQ